VSWVLAHGIGTALIEPDKPWQNGVSESFNGKFRDECLSLEKFRSRAEAHHRSVAAALQARIATPICLCN
jgi:putative transposase